MAYGQKRTIKSGVPGPGIAAIGELPRSAGQPDRYLTLRFDQLSPRQRECLRLVYVRRTTKEIARELGIAHGTVASYIAEAVAILGARDRREAAELLHVHEEGAPYVSRGAFVGEAEPASDPSTIPATGRPAHPLGPLAPGNRDADNDSSITTRLAWIVLLAIGLAIGFASLASGLRTFSDLFENGHIARRE